MERKTTMVAPESPDMKYARDRLGTLLIGMRTTDLSTTTTTTAGANRSAQTIARSPDHSGDDDTEYDVRNETSQGRPRRAAAMASSSGRGGGGGGGGRGRRRDRRNLSFVATKHSDLGVVFELRGKPFELRDSGREESVFSLCRTWMHGKEDDSVKQETIDAYAYPAPSDDSLDLLATKEIQVLPRPHTDQPSPSPIPTIIWKSASPSDLNVESKAAILNDFVGHWRATKRHWCEHSKEKEKRYVKSIKLLETVFGIAQQNQLMA